jgi:hypothetical protein
MISARLSHQRLSFPSAITRQARWSFFDR